VFLLFQRQSDLVTTRSREVRARADLAEAQASLDRATSQTLDVYYIGVK
jgi:hypothetical protein